MSSLLEKNMTLKTVGIILIILGVIFAVISAVLFIQSILLTNQYLKKKINEQDKDRKK
jgi:predicted RND superfamily exporter protein